MEVYPNPANDFLTVNVNPEFSNAVFSITDICGKILVQGILSSGETKININDLSPGLYILKSGDENERAVKFLKN